MMAINTLGLSWVWLRCVFAFGDRLVFVNKPLLNKNQSINPGLGGTHPCFAGCDQCFGINSDYLSDTFKINGSSGP